MTNSKHLERQADHTREELATTLDELRARLAPAHLSREAIDAIDAARHSLSPISEATIISEAAPASTIYGSDRTGADLGADDALSPSS